MKRYLLFTYLLFASSVVAAPSAADEIFAAFQSKAVKGEKFDDLFKAAGVLPIPDQVRLISQIDQRWLPMRTGYINQLNLTAKGMGGKKTEVRQELRKHRAAFMEVFAKDDAAMKPLLKSVSMPAIEELRKLLMPGPAQVIEAGGEKLKSQRKLIFSLATFRDGVLKEAYSNKPQDSVVSLEAAEKLAAAAASGFSRSDMKVLENNRKIAKEKDVPPAEVRGIEECNELRMLVGLNALTIDPKLCAAARDHSKDMKEKGFFAHESPVPGKKSPWDRAKNFGTTASSENIFMGSSDPHAAITGWFYSPGHHKNMFGPNHARIGLGCTGNHWTQMFGR